MSEEQKKDEEPEPGYLDFTQPYSIKRHKTWCDEPHKPTEKEWEDLGRA